MYGLEFFQTIKYSACSCCYFSGTDGKVSFLLGGKSGLSLLSESPTLVSPGMKQKRAENAGERDGGKKGNAKILFSCSFPY